MLEYVVDILGSILERPQRIVVDVDVLGTDRREVAGSDILVEISHHIGIDEYLMFSTAVNIRNLRVIKRSIVGIKDGSYCVPILDVEHDTALERLVVVILITIV